MFCVTVHHCIRQGAAAGTSRSFGFRVRGLGAVLLQRRCPPDAPARFRRVASLAQAFDRFRHLAIGKLAVFTPTGRLMAPRRFYFLPTCDGTAAWPPTECIPFVTEPGGKGLQLL